MLTCPSNITVPNDTGDCGAVVTFANPTETGNCGGVITSDHPSGSFFPVGTTTVTFTDTRLDGSTATCSFNVTVNDTASPNVSAATASPNVLWPPEHQLVPVTVNYTATDNCSVGSVLTVTSNEAVNGLGDGDTAPDWQVVDAHHLMLRSERAGKGSGRLYTITVTCTDPAGHTVVRTTTVTVPKSQARIATAVDSTSRLATPTSAGMTGKASAATPGGTPGNRGSVTYVPYLNLRRNEAGTTEQKSTRKKKHTRKTSVR